MGVEAGNFQLTEYSKEVIPMLNYKMEDLFCRYGVSIPYFILDFSFPDYQGRAEWVVPYNPQWLSYQLPDWPSFYYPDWILGYRPEWRFPSYQIERMEWPTFQQPTLPTQWPDWFASNGFSFNSDWGEWGYNLPWFNELLGLLFDAADLPRWQMPDFSNESMAMLNSKLNELYEAVVKVPVASFTSDITSGDVPFTVTFTDTSTNEPTSWLWDFGDGETSEEQNPEHEYTIGGICTVELTATNAAGSDTETKIDYITAYYEFESQTKDGDLFKRSPASEVSWMDAWNNLPETPTVRTVVTYVYVYLRGYFTRYEDPRLPNDWWRALKGRAYLSFDTSSLSGKTINSVKLKIYPHNTVSFDNISTPHILNIYQQTWGTLDTADWNGGTLKGSIDGYDLVDDEYNEITLETDCINKEGETQLKLAWKGDIDGDIPNDPELYCEGETCAPRTGGGWCMFSSGDAASNKPLLVVTVE